MPSPHTPSPSICPRQIAWTVLCEYELNSTFAGDLLDHQFRTTGAEPHVRRLATQIALGAIRRQATLDVVLKAHITRPQENVEPELWNLLRVGAYQVLFLATAPHAAVNETVNVTHRNQKSHWSKFINGVLRSILRSLTEQTVGRPATNTIPIENGKYRVYDKDLFADPAAAPAEFLSQAFSFPQWLVERWLLETSPPELVKQLFYFNTPPPLTLRINSTLTDREEYQVLLADDGIEFRAGQVDNTVTLTGQHPAIPELPGYNEGWFCVQDQAAAAAAIFLDPQPGENILDLCSAPGTKTTHIAELMNDTGTILATDVDQSRLDKVEQNAERLGLKSIETQPINRDGSDIPDGPFDAVLVDVPCSNTGVLSRRPEARWRLTPEDFTELADIQAQLLIEACDRVKPGGRVVYSTCSIDHQENRAVVDAILAIRPNVVLEEEQRHSPGQPADGAWQCRLRISE